MPLAEWQKREIARVIRDHVGAFSFAAFGYDVIPKKELQRLIDEGILPPEVDLDLVEQSFVLGKLQAHIPKESFDSLSFDELKEEAKKFKPANRYEELVIEEAKTICGTKLQGVADDIKNGMYMGLQEALKKDIDESVVQGIISSTVEHGIKEHLTAIRVSYHLAHNLAATEAQDFMRTAATEMHDVRQRGYVSAIINGEGLLEDLTSGLKTRVYVVTMPGACKDCVRYFTDSKTGLPKVFVLEDLIAMGNNVGVPKKDRHPCVPPAHPHCFCEILILPDYHVFDEEGDVVPTKEFYDEARKRTQREAEQEKT